MSDLTTTTARSAVAEAGGATALRPTMVGIADATALAAAGFADVGSVHDVPMLEGRDATVDGRRVAVFRLPTGFSATDAACPHKGGPLSDGLVADGCVTCPLHNWRLDLATGVVEGDDTVVPIHDVVVHDDRLWVRIAEGAGAPAAPAPRVTAGAIGEQIAASPKGDANPFVASRPAAVAARTAPTADVATPPSETTSVATADRVAPSGDASAPGSASSAAA